MALTTSAHEILRAAKQAGDDEIPDEIWALIERHRGTLINQAYAILGNLQDAEEVVQESLCELYQKRAKLSEARSVGAFIRTINRRNALDRLRSDRRDSKRAQQKHEDLGRPESTTGGFSQLDAREIVAKAIETLPDRMREVVILRYWEHLSYEAIGKRLDLPTSTVWQLFYDASEQLFEKLQPQVPAEPQLEAEKQSEGRSP